ncbi:MAG: copper resistance protein CopC [Actinomycetota bacterium]
MIPRTARRLVFVVVAVALGVVFPLAPGAKAHANLRSSDPTADARLDAPPEAVSITFTEPPELSLSSIQVLDSGGRSLSSGSPRTPSGDPLTLLQEVAPLPEGVYTVTWRVVSRADGHATAGAFAFGVGVSPLEAPPPPRITVPKTPPLSPLEVAGRWLFIAGLVALLGATAVGLVAFKETPKGVRALAWAGWGSAAGGLVALGAAQWGASEAGIATFASTSVGRAVGWRAAGLAGAALGLALAGSRGLGLRRAGAAVAAVAAASAMFAEVAAGHAAAAQSLRLAKVFSQWTHFIAVGVWIGGLAGLLVGIRGRADERKAEAVRRFSLAAGVALVIVAVTGTIRAVNEVGSWRSLVTTGYGWVVVTKIGLLGALAGLGAVNRYRNVRRADRDLSGLRTVSRAELTVAGVVLAATALLTGLSPPIKAPAAAVSGPGALVVTGSDFATTMRVRLEAQPGFPGPNRFALRVTDFDSGQPVQADRVALRFSVHGGGDIGRSILELRPGGAGLYVATGANLSLEAFWIIDVLVQQEGDSVEIPLHLGTRCRVRALSTSGQPTIYTTVLPGGGQVQGYVDPGVTGLNEVHFTFFDQAGSELPIEGEPMVMAARGGTVPEELEVRRFSPGHFIAGAPLDVGTWRFEIAAPVAADETYRACFVESVRQR